jgi:hypothetical protein
MNISFREKLKKIKLFKYVTVIGRTFSIKPNFGTRIKRLLFYFNDYRNYKNLETNPAYILNTADLFPRINDKTTSTDIDPVYYIQGVWCVRKIFENKPKRHYDIGSQAIMVGIISQFVPTTMIDIRPLSVSLPELSFVKGDITALPLKDESIESLSSICVIEHIGLGRYGDTLDQFGTEKSASELSRVLAKNGNLYISVPIDTENKIYFNAHRAFNRDYILELFKELKLVEEKYIYGKEVYNFYDKNKGFGTGLFHFKK